MPRLVLLDLADAAHVQAAVALLVTAGADPEAAADAIDTLLEGVPAQLDVGRPDGLVADLAECGIEAEIMADDEAIPAD